jgi:hypothetical protein
MNQKSMKKKRVLNKNQLDALAKGRAKRNANRKLKGVPKVSVVPVPIIVEPIKIPRRGRPIGRKEKVRLTKEELHVIRVAAGKKAAATRRARKLRSNEFTSIIKSLRTLEPLKLEYSKFNPIEEKKEIKEIPEVIIVKSEKYNYYDGLVVEFTENNDDYSQKLLDCLKVLQNKKLNTMDADILAKCLNNAYEGYKHVSNIYENIPKHFKEMAKSDQKIRNEAIGSFLELADHLNGFTKVLLKDFKHIV